MRMGIKCLGAALVCDIPDTKRFVVGGGEKELSSWMHQEGSHPIVVAGKREQTNTRADVPEFDCLITRAGDEKRSCPAGVDVVGDGWRRGVGRCGLVDRRLSGIWRPCHTLYDVIMLP